MSGHLSLAATAILLVKQTPLDTALHDMNVQRPPKQPKVRRRREGILAMMIRLGAA